MGNTVSQATVQEYNGLLSQFSSPNKIDREDQFWKQLLAFPLPLSQIDPRNVEHTITACCADLGERSLGPSLHEFEALAPMVSSVQLSGHDKSCVLQSVTMEVPKTFKCCCIICSLQFQQASSMSQGP